MGRGLGFSWLFKIKLVEVLLAGKLIMGMRPALSKLEGAKIT